MSELLDMSKKVQVLVVIGCGGVYYHGRGAMQNWVARRGRDKVAVVFVDPDTLEERNALRQWPGDVQEGVVKSVVAMMDFDVLDEDEEFVALAGGVSSVCTPFSGEPGQGLSNFVGAAGDEFTRQAGGTSEVIGVNVMVFPDNHACRVEALKQCIVLSAERGIPVRMVTAGNDETSGWAYSTVVRGGVVYGDWREKHPDIVEEAKLELAGTSDPLGCGALGNTAEQSVRGNMLTATLAWDLAEKMLGGKVGEAHWDADPENEELITLRTQMQ